MTARRLIARTSAAALVAGSLLVAAGPAQAAAGPEGIIGGHTAPAGSWPSIVRVLTEFTENGQQFVSKCGGTVIAPHWVLTAGHCTFTGDAATPSIPSQMTVIAGRHDLTATGTGEELGVAQIVRHPNYDANGSLSNDVALLRLTAATAAPPMQTATQASASANVYTTPANVPNTAGWGWTAVGDSTSGSTTLNETYIPLRNNGDCVTELAAIGSFDPSNMVCAGASGPATTTCHGDSGGPLIVFAGSTPVLWGVTSWGDERCADGIGAYARVAAFESFLAQAVSENAPATTPVAATVAPPPPPPPSPPPAAPAPAPVAVNSPSAPAARVDRVSPTLSHFRIPGRVFVRGGRLIRAIAVQLHSSEAATLQITLLRKSGRTLRVQPRAFRARVGKGTSRMTLPRSLWRMTPGSYRLRIRATDAAGNSRTIQASIRALAR
jgi:secreted trypsin-like serine protease